MSFRDLAAAALAVAITACGSVEQTRDVVCGAQPIEVMPNGSFDAPTPAWTQDPVNSPLPMICGAPRITPFDGAASACLGSTDGTVRTLTQEVPLPAGARSVKLSGQICIATAETQPVEHDVLQFDLLDGDTPVAALGKQTNLQGVPDCQFKPFELVAAATSDPVSATLRIRSTLDTDRPTSFYIDALHLAVSCSP
jgi:hypothetical protein